MSQIGGSMLQKGLQDLSGRLKVEGFTLLFAQAYVRSPGSETPWP